MYKAISRKHSHNWYFFRSLVMYKAISRKHSHNWYFFRSLQSAFTRVLWFDPQTGIKNHSTFPMFPRNKMKLREVRLLPKVIYAVRSSTDLSPALWQFSRLQYVMSQCFQIFPRKSRMMCREWGVKLTSVASKEVPVSALILTQSLCLRKSYQSCTHSSFHPLNTEKSPVHRHWTSRPTVSSSAHRKLRSHQPSLLVKSQTDCKINKSSWIHKRGAGTEQIATPKIRETSRQM